MQWAKLKLVKNDCNSPPKFLIVILACPSASLLCKGANRNHITNHLASGARFWPSTQPMFIAISLRNMTHIMHPALHLTDELASGWVEQPAVHLDRFSRFGDRFCALKSWQPTATHQSTLLAKRDWHGLQLFSQSGCPKVEHHICFCCFPTDEKGILCHHWLYSSIRGHSSPGCDHMWVWYD